METELKLLVSPRDLRRVLRSRPVTSVRRGTPRSSRVVSTYYDTPDRQLWQQGVTLRLRRHGRQWLQTLKGPSRGTGLHDREEFEWPLAEGALDLELLKQTPYKRLFRRKAREQLRRAFVTDFSRRAVDLQFADGTRAELALDTGEVRSGKRSAPISEVEVELKSGDSAALVEFAYELLGEVPFRVGHASKAARGFGLDSGRAAPVKAGAMEIHRRMPASELLVEMVRCCSDHARANEDGFLRGGDPEYLHQLRVGLRRLRAVVSLPREDEWRSAVMPLREELRWVWVALGSARNWDVICDEILSEAAQHDRSSDLETLRRRALRLRRDEIDKARAAVNSERYQHVWLALTRLCDSYAKLVAPRRTARQFADAALARRYRRMMRWGDPFPASADALHRLRIESKKLRYIAQMFAPLYRGTKPFLSSLSTLQDLLGTVHDASVSTGLIDRAAANGPRPLDRKTVDRVRGRIEAQRDEAQRDLARAWKRFERCQPFWD